MKNHRIRAIAAAASVATASLALAISTSTAAADAIWTGATSSNWNDGTNWTGGTGTTPSAGVPGSTDNIDIGTSSPAQTIVTYNVGGLTTSGNLLVDSGYTLEAVSGNQGLLEIGTPASPGTPPLTNNGTIEATGAGTSWSIYLHLTSGSGPSNIAINTGTIEAANKGTLDLYGNTLTGGQASYNNNGGTIETDSNTGSTLDLSSLRVANGTVTNNVGSTMGAPGGSSQNYFVNVEFSNAGTLSFIPNGGPSTGGSGLVTSNGTSFNNTGNALFHFAGADISTSYNSSAASAAYLAIGLGSTDPTAATFTNSSTMTFEETEQTATTTGAATLTFDTKGSDGNGKVINDGSITFEANATNGGGTADLYVGLNTDIDNSAGHTGTIVFADNAGNNVDYLPTTPTVHSTLSLGTGQTLSGSVALGNGHIGITNNGTIDANGTVNPMVISTYNNSFSNNGTLHVSGAAGAQILDTSFSNAGELQVDDVAGAGRTLDDSGGSLAFANGSSYVVQIDSDNLTSGQIDIAGGLTIDSGATLSVSDIGSTPLTGGQVFTLIDPSSTTGNFDGYAEGSTVVVGDNTFTVSYFGGSSGDDLTLTAVPEPASCALLAVAGLGLLKRRRRAR